MPTVNPQTRFLARASLLVILLLVFWWFILINPLTSLLKGSVQIFGSMFWGGAASELIKETPSADWSVDFPLDFSLPQPPPQSGIRQVHSVGFDIPRSSVISFTFGLPVFWALILAAPGLRDHWQAALWGTLSIIAIETLLVLIFADISAHRVADQLSHSETDLSKWFLHLGEYLVVNVIPFIAPLLVALTLHKELQQQILGWQDLPATRFMRQANMRPANKLRGAPR